MFERLNRGVDDSMTFVANRRAYGEVSFRPRAAAVRQPRSTRTTVLGAEISTPVLLAPVGALRLQHPAGVQAAVAAGPNWARCARSARRPATPSRRFRFRLEHCSGTRSPPPSAGATSPSGSSIRPGARYQAVVVTVDSGLRPRAAPLRLDARTAADLVPDLLRHPRWTWDSCVMACACPWLARRSGGHGARCPSSRMG